jgi:branched-chain amino acid transport system ATP-binding protein
MSFLEIDKIYVSYGDLPVLREVSLKVEEGESVAIIGGNGAGKTTLLKAISAQVSLRSGKLWFLQKRIDGLKPHEIVSQGVVHVPEGRRLFPFMSVLENLELGAYRQDARSEREGNLKKVYNLFPRLKERRSQFAGSLSGGEQQMLAIGRALMARPKLLMLDEPSMGLSPLLVTELFRSIKEINSQGISILLVEQNPKKALAASHRGYLIENGRILHEGMAEKLLETEYLKRAYLGI